MHLQFHLDNLGWALRHLETYVTSQAGAAGEEALAKFRQTFDFLHTDVSNSADLQAQLTSLRDMLAAAQKRAEDAEAALAQFKAHVADVQEAAPPPPAPSGAALNGDAPLLAEALTRVHVAFANLLLLMREFGTLPPELETAIGNTSNAIDTALMLSPRTNGDQAPTGSEQAPADQQQSASSTPAPDGEGQPQGAAQAPAPGVDANAGDSSNEVKTE